MALADFRRTCGSTAAGAGMAIATLIVTWVGFGSSVDQPSLLFYAFVLLILSCVVLPLGLGATVAVRHFRAVEQSGLPGGLHVGAVLVPAAFFAGGLYLLFGGQLLLALLLVQGAPAASLLLLALSFASRQGAWPRATLIPGAGGLAVSLLLVLVLSTAPEVFLGAVFAGLGPALSAGTALVTLLLIAPAAQLALGLAGRFIPLRLRTDGPPAPP